MCEEWMPLVKVPMSIDQFHELPRNPAYKYEYLNGQAYLSPRPKHYHALLELSPMSAQTTAEIRPARAEEFPALEAIFSGAFGRIQPFGSLADDRRREAACQSLERTRTGGDGPWIAPASFIAWDRESQEAIGAILITLLPDGDPCDWDSYYWRDPPPPDCIARRLGRPHLTWIFVGPWYCGEGLGSALLAAAVNALLELGFTQLATTFLVGNDSSMLWHWRNGFRLLAYPGSKRTRRQRWQAFASPRQSDLPEA
jgi:hypothetical protein